MTSITDLIPRKDLNFPLRQLLPSHSRSNEVFTPPQIKTLWRYALAFYRPFTLQTEYAVTAHKNLLKHLINDQAAFSPKNAVDPFVPSKAWLTTTELNSPTHAPYVLILYLNLGLIRAWLGEDFRAAYYFHTATSMIDPNLPANTAVLYYLLGCAQYMLKQWKASRKSFHRCFLAFRRRDQKIDPDEGELELDMAAPWVGALLDRHQKKERREDRKSKMEKCFTYKLYVPSYTEDDEPTPREKNAKREGWEEWTLERGAVEANLTAAKVKLAQEESGKQTSKDESIGEIHGIPGGALFYPLDEPGSAAIPQPKEDLEPDLEIPERPPQPELDVEQALRAQGLPELKAPVWNKETQSFEPYLSPPDTLPAGPLRAASPPGFFPRPAALLPDRPKSLWLQIDSEPLPSAENQDDLHHLKTDNAISPSDYDASPPPTEGSAFLGYYTDPHASRAAFDTHGQPTPNLETNRQRLERAAEIKQSVRRETLALLEGQKLSRSKSGGFKGLVRRSMASLKRASSFKSESVGDEEDGIEDWKLSKGTPMPRFLPDNTLGSAMARLHREIAREKELERKEKERAIAGGWWVEDVTTDEKDEGKADEERMQRLTIKETVVEEDEKGEEKEEQQDDGLAGLGDGGTLLPLSYTP